MTKVGAKMTKPVHLCIGAPRSGTTWLFNNLRDQPGIFTPIVKEVRYWNSRRSGAEVSRTIEWSNRSLPDVPDRAAQESWLDKWVRIEQNRTPDSAEYLDLMGNDDIPSLDITPSYSIADPALPKTLAQILPAGSRVVYLIRHPLNRAESQLKLHMNMHGLFRGRPDPETLTEYATHPLFLRRTDYSRTIREWSEAFGDDFRWFNYDDLERDPAKFLRSITDYLDIDLDPVLRDRAVRVYFGTDRNQREESVHPRLGSREKSILAQSILSPVKAFAVTHPEPGREWLNDVSKTAKASTAEIKFVADVSADVAKLMRITESLGDNCEYGFWQRHRGYEPSSLFRWAITPLDALIDYLRDPLGLYNLDDLDPHSPGMVSDTASGFKFHSSLVESDGKDGLQLLADKKLRAEIHEQEKQKIDFLARRFHVFLKSKPGLYIVKRNTPVSRRNIEDLSGLLHKANPDHLLVWAEKGDRLGVEEIEPGLLRAELPAFADYSRADAYLDGGWTRIMHELVELPQVKKLLSRAYR